MVAYYRLRTAFNICAAVHALHQKGYVIGDLKPVNIFVLPNGLISIADLDSIQIHTKEGHFPSMAVTPEYAPPEAGLGSPKCPSNKAGTCSALPSSFTVSWWVFILSPVHSSRPTTSSPPMKSLYAMGSTRMAKSRNSLPPYPMTTKGSLRFTPHRSLKPS
ncbi:hypothetical protein [Thermonema sp.]|uniref:protein kinase domain-containing protein n=1 Tax=Thermonema sp. TaxID=2231181 RepID=UPI0035B6343F